MTFVKQTPGAAALAMAMLIGSGLAVLFGTQVAISVAGNLGSSRYTRIALVDLDASTADSYHEFVTPDDAKGMITTSPRFTRWTSRPTSSTRPIASCPMRCPPGSGPKLYGHKSLPGRFSRHSKKRPRHSSRPSPVQIFPKP